MHLYNVRYIVPRSGFVFIEVVEIHFAEVPLEHQARLVHKALAMYDLAFLLEWLCRDLKFIGKIIKLKKKLADKVLHRRCTLTKWCWPLCAITMGQSILSNEAKSRDS